MLGPSFPLRQISDDILQELDPAKTNRPLEWRRHFNIINFVLNNPNVVVDHQVNEVDVFAEIGKRSPSRPLVKACGGTKIVVRGTVDRLQRGDRFFGTRKAEGDDPTVFKAVAGKDGVYVEISAGEPAEGDEDFASGTYPGTLIAWDKDLDIDDLTLDLRASGATLEMIAAAIQGGNAAALALQVGVRVFSYEVDDALRHYTHQRTFVLHGEATQAALLKVNTLPKTAISKTDAETDAEVWPPPDQPQHLPTGATLRTQNLSALSAPLWTIAGILLLLWVTR